MVTVTFFDRAAINDSPVFLKTVKLTVQTPKALASNSA
jgi:hypothetical protein